LQPRKNEKGQLPGHGCLRKLVSELRKMELPVRPLRRILYSRKDRPLKSVRRQGENVRGCVRAAANEKLGVSLTSELSAVVRAEGTINRASSLVRAGGPFFAHKPASCRRRPYGPAPRNGGAIVLHTRAKSTIRPEAESGPAAAIIVVARQTVTGGELPRMRYDRFRL
jgi:hypothetical protein